MKKALLSILLLNSILFAVDGYEVYKMHCASCHVETMKEKEALKKLNVLSAPPMPKVAQRVKENIIVADEDDDVHRYLFVLFVKDYVINPLLDNSMCEAVAINKFGVMPSLKGNVNEKERRAVAEWIYDRF